MMDRSRPHASREALWVIAHEQWGCLLGFSYLYLKIHKFDKSARLAQSVEHETLNLRVVGSSPTLGDKHFLFPFFSLTVGRLHSLCWFMKYTCIGTYIILFLFYYFATQNKLEVEWKKNRLINIKFKMSIQLGRRGCGGEISDKHILTLFIGAHSK